MSENTPWRDPETLRRLYHEQGLTQAEVAEELGCSTVTVNTWLDKFDIDEDYLSRGIPCDREELFQLYHEKGLSQREIAEKFDCEANTVSQWMNEFDIETGYSYISQLRDPDWLQTEYSEKKRSLRDIAGELSCSISSVSEWLEKHDIEKRSPTHQRTPYYRTDHYGYECAEVTVSGQHQRVAIHRLVAVAEYGVDVVKGVDIHHENNISWDNRPDNLRPMSRSEHRSTHAEEQQRNDCGRFA